MTDKLKTHQDRISIITNNLDFQLQQFDKLLSLQQKKTALEELNSLMLQFEQIVFYLYDITTNSNRINKPKTNFKSLPKT